MATTALIAAVALAAALEGAAAAPAGTQVCASIEEVGDHEAWGIGGPRSSYADGSTKCWVLRGASHVTVDLSFFETEYVHDFLRLYDGEAAADAAVELSGEVPRSFVWRSTSPTVYAVFAADGSFRANEETEQLGFEATAFDSSDGATCAKACSGHGACVDGLCDCVDGWGPDADTDCSTRVATLEPGVAAAVDGVAVGAWSYFSFDAPADAPYLVEIVDRSGAAADPRLMVKFDSLPTRSAHDATDWFDWFYDCSDLHHVRGAAPGGRAYVGVVNDPRRAAAPLSFDVTVRVGAIGSRPCLQDCDGHGACDGDYGTCTCDEGWEGSIVNWPDTCRFEVRPLELEKTHAAEVRIGDWDYYKFTVDAATAHTKSLFVEFYSSSPLSYPILLARRGAVPRLDDGWLPSLSTFEYPPASLTDARLPGAGSGRFPFFLGTTPRTPRGSPRSGASASRCS